MQKFLNMEKITMFKILVVGSNGQLGSEIQALHANYPYIFLFTDKEELDIVNKSAIELMCKKNNITHIVNCAAYTAVDKAEDEESLADAINNQAVANLAEIAKKNSISLVHISTDYVFDGVNHKPYIETSKTNPLCVYGKTKLDGEMSLLQIGAKNSIIIRTSWVYSSFGSNFVKTMIRLGKEKKSLNVVFDQIGSPTYAKDLAKTILDILPQIKNHKPEVYHYANEGVCSWYDFAKEIMKQRKLTCNIVPITTDKYPTKASRPHFSVLNKDKLKSKYDIKVPYWKDSLHECLQAIGEKIND